MRGVKVNIVEREAAQIEFIADFERRQQIFFLVRMVRISVDTLDVLLHSLDAMCHHHGVEAVPSDCGGRNRPHKTPAGDVP